MNAKKGIQYNKPGLLPRRLAGHADDDGEEHNGGGSIFTFPRRLTDWEP